MAKALGIAGVWVATAILPAREGWAQTAPVFAEVAAPLTRGADIRRLGSTDVLFELHAAEEALAYGFVSVARDLFGAVLAREELRPEVQLQAALGLAAAELNAGRADAAVAALERGGPEVGTTAAGRLRMALVALERRQVEAAAALVEAVDPTQLPEAEVSWWWVARAMVAEGRGDFAGAQRAYAQATERATSTLARARVVLAQERAKLVFGEATEELAARLRRQVEDFAGRQVGYDFAKQYAVVLDRLGRSGEAVAVLERQLQLIPPEERQVADRMRLLLALVGQPTSGAAQNALRQVLGPGGDPGTQRVALQLLATTATAGQLRERFARELDERLAAPGGGGPIREDLLFYRARLALGNRNYPLAEEDARTLLAHYPGSPLRAAALNVLVASAWELRRYRTAADTIAQLMAELPPGPNRAVFAVQRAEAFFRAGDFRNAAESYAAALEENPPGIARGALLFQLVSAWLRAGRPDEAEAELARRAGDPGFDAVSRWRAEWNLARARIARGETAVAHARIDREWGGGGGGNVAPGAGAAVADLPAELRLRMAWLHARLAFDAGDAEAAIRLTDELRAMLAATPPGELSADLAAELTGTTLLLRAEALLASGRVEDGMAQLAALRREFAGSDSAVYSFIVQAGYLSAQGRTVEAQRLLVQLADEHAGSAYAPYALFEAAGHAERRGLDVHLREAYELLERLAVSFPRDPLVFHARLRQGDLLRKLNQFGAAQQIYEFLTIHFQDHRDVALAELALADTLSAQAATDPAKRESALARYERLFDLPTLTPDLRIEAGFKHGLALASRGDTAGGRRSLWLVVTRFLLAEGSAPELGALGRYWLSRALLEYGRLCEQDRNLEEAREAYELILRRDLWGANLARDRLARVSPGWNGSG